MNAIDAIDGSDLIDKFRTREARVAIIGLGYVGLPLAMAFAEAGFLVVGIGSERGTGGYSERRQELHCRYSA